MGTNYYLHLGKTTSQGEGRPLLFTAATDIELIHGEGGAVGWVMDEYGREIAWPDFMAKFYACQRDLSHYGEQFS
jgi:hypothetical protein